MALHPEILDRPPSEGARTVVLAFLAEARERAGRLGDPGDEEALHDFRVSVRRLRSALRAWRDALGGAVRDKDLRRLRRVARATGDARDAEVLLAWIGRAAGSLPPAHRAAAGVALPPARAAGRDADLSATVERFVEAADSLSRRLKRERPPPSRETFGEAIAVRIREQAAAVAAWLSRVETPADAPLAHRARIEGKRLRYLLEPLRDAPGVESADAVKALKELQDLLGELNDAAVAADVLRAARHDAEAERMAAAKPGRTRARSSEPGAARARAPGGAARRGGLRAAPVGGAPRRGELAARRPALAVAAALDAAHRAPDQGRASGTRTRSAPGSRVQRAGRRPGCSPSTSSSTSAPSSGSASTTRPRRQRVLGSFTWVPS